MSQPTPQQILITGAVVALIAWRMYSRVRRLIGRQRLSVKRVWIRIVLFPLVVALLAFSVFMHPEALGYLACGVAIGLALGALGLRLTKYEVTGEGLFYTPSAHLGIALSMLLIARIAYRFAVYGLPGAGGQPAPGEHADTAHAAARGHAGRLLLDVRGRSAALVGAQPGRDRPAARSHGARGTLADRRGATARAPWES